MAIISIPTSIAGISIPGALVNGPLGALFGNKFGHDFLQYPRDLQSATRGHVIQFTIQEVDPLSYEQNKSFLANVDDLYSSVKNSITNFTDKVSSGSLTTDNLAFAQPKTKSAGTISLYIPDTVNFQYGASYTDTSMVGAVKDVVSGAAGAVSPLAGRVVDNVASAVTSDMSKIGQQSAGYAMNPQQQLLFQSITFRTFQLAFTFTPYSKEEADTVTKIIKKFKTHAAPKLVTQSAGMFFNPPSMFDIRFLFNGSDNPNINKVARSVIESIDVNYAPNGWAAHTDGAPVQTTLTMNFKEMILLDRTKLEQGY